MEKILHIAPAQRCTGHACQRLTNLAFAEPMSSKDDTQLLLNPKCWQHGFAQASPAAGYFTEREEQASVVRFVLGYHRGKGMAQVLKRVDVREVPGYRPDRAEDHGVMYFQEKAWKVRYTDLDGKRREVYVVWSFSRLVFLMRDPVRLQQKLKA